MNKTELVAAMADQAGLSKKDAEKALKAFTDVVAEELKKDGKVQLVGFGTFEVSSRAAREGRNPQSGKPMKIAASKAPKFKAGDIEEMQILIHADDFLHNMARIIVGTLMDIGLGNRSVQDIDDIFAGILEASAPCDPKGLYLQEITY